MSIVAGEMRNPEKNVPRAILGSISIVSVLYMLIIAGTIAMLGGRIMQTGAPVQDAFVEMIGPIGAPLVSYGALISIAGLNIGESIMVPRFGAALATEKLLPEGLGKTNSKNAPVIAIIISGIFRLLTLVIWLFRNISNLQCCLPFLPIHSNSFGSHQTQKNVPRQKGYLPSTIWSRYPSSSRCDQYLDDCRGQPDELCLGCHRPSDRKWTLLCFHGDKLHKSKTLPH